MTDISRESWKISERKQQNKTPTLIQTEKGDYYEK